MQLKVRHIVTLTLLDGSLCKYWFSYIYVPHSLLKLIRWAWKTECEFSRMNTMRSSV